MPPPALETAPTAQMQSNDERIGQQIGPFLVEEKIGQGTTGRVYRARTSDRNLVALKIMDRRFNTNHETAYLSTELIHPNTVTTHELGATPDHQAYVAMELLEGETLDNAIKTRGAFPVSKVISIAYQIACSLREAHDIGLIHQDLKPANIMLIKDAAGQESIKVLDFGLSAEASSPNHNQQQQSQLRGSPNYISPEQIKALQIKPSTDQYSLGIVLFELLTGHPPFRCANILATFDAHLNEPVPQHIQSVGSTRIPSTLIDVVHQLLAKKPESRFSTIADVLPHLQHALWEQTRAGTPSLYPT